MKIGTVKIASPFCQAGLAGYSDRAMRLVARRRGCAYAVTEALLDTILLNGGIGLKKSIDINDEDHPIAGQLIGSEPDEMAAAARILHAANYDVIDLNFACPVKKIKNRARGGHMLLDIDRGKAILNSVRDTLPSDRPTTVSLRRAFDDSNESADRFESLVEHAFAIGYSAVRVHARTVEQKYLGRADWSVLRELKRRYPKKTILGSGDVFCAEDAVRMLRETGVDIVWIARGAIGNPWIFNQANLLLEAERHFPLSLGEGEGVSVNEAASELEHALTPTFSRGERRPEPEAPTIFEQRDALREHFLIAMQIHGESLAGRRMRKMGIKYSRFHPLASEVKSSFIEIKSLRDWNDVLDRFYREDGPGIIPMPTASDEVNASIDLQTCEM